MTKRIKSGAEIYTVLEEVMGKIDKPLIVRELLDIPEIYTAVVNRWGKDTQNSFNKFSDMLGFMYRRGLVDRYAAHSANSMARYAYQWRVVDTPMPKIVRSSLPNGHALTITEKDGEVILDFSQFTICIKPK